uniref:uncharacterized protein LOC109952820 n=1 Tax=Monopterus albus TaxID=43700 RepID=UPI0009B4818F|nr:uncharacterized protein LOC109952820 [Monopterus albus]
MAGFTRINMVLFLMLELQFTVTEQKDTDKLTLLCSLWTDGRCIYTVKWLLKGNDVDKDNKDLKTSQSPCNATLTFLISNYIYSFRDKLLTCEVTNRDQRFNFTFQPTGEDTITATTQSTTDITEASPTAAFNPQDWWWWYIVVAVVFVALLILVAAIIRWKRAKGNKTPMNDSIALSSKSAVTQSAPETSQDTVDPEDGVSYASISFTTKANSKARVQMKSNDNKGEAITYATVNASSTDPSDLYASII